MTQSSVTNNQCNYNKIYYVLSYFKTKSALVSALVPLLFFNFQENTNFIINTCMVIIFWTIGAVHFKFTQIYQENVCPTSSVLDTCNTNSAFCF